MEISDLGRTVYIRPPTGVVVPKVKCLYGCSEGKAGWAWTFTEDSEGRFCMIEHPVCDNCGTTSIRIVKEKKLRRKVADDSVLSADK